VCTSPLLQAHFPLNRWKETLIQLNSVVQPVGEPIRAARASHRVVHVVCIYQLMTLFAICLNCSEPLEIIDPTQTSDDDEGGTTIKSEGLEPEAHRVRERLARAMKEHFLKTYVLKAEGAKRPWIWDMIMYPFPPRVAELHNSEAHESYIEHAFPP
jgi:hypothetical protein